MSVSVYTNLDEIPDDFGPSAVTIGKFDGLHLGHQHMIDRLLLVAESESLVPVVLTFDRNPLALLAPAECPSPLVSNEQKMELLDDSAVAATLMLEFSRDFSQRSAEEFVQDILVSTLHAKVVLVGDDFRFGQGGKGNVGLLEEWGDDLGFRVERLPSVEVTGRRVSSTWLRELLSEGRVRDADELLGRHPMLRGTVVRGAQRGRELGFPTANLSAGLEGFVPADGVYAAWAVVDRIAYPSAVSIGNNPTFDDVADRQVEAYLMAQDFSDMTLELYGKTLELGFVDRVRGMTKFDGMDSLVAGIAADVKRVREILRDDVMPRP